MASRTRGGSLLSSANGSQQNAQSVANQTPNASNTPVNQAGVTALTQMSDDQLEALLISSKSVDMPNHLSDVTDPTQKFVFSAGLNGKPQVLDQKAFDKYMKDNNISQSQVLARTVGGANYTVNGTNIRLSPQQVASMTKDSALNYIGGKHGGMLHGAGTYFDQNGGRQTGYGSGQRTTMVAVLSKNAKVVDESKLYNMATSWAKSHPKSAKQIGRINSHNQSIYALAMGYNVIKYSSYHNVIDRTALVMRQNDI